jgi:predicted metal-binding protein
MKAVESINKPEKYTIKALEDMLEEAKSGEITGLVYAAVHGDGKCSHGEVGDLTSQPNRLAGALANALLKYQLDHVLEYTPYESID